MRRFTAIARTAAIETMSQPLSAILFPVALLAVHLLPAFQYHRFGAPGRLAREAGLSLEEAAEAIAAGFIPVHLGPSRLRTETAALTAVEAVYLHHI